MRPEEPRGRLREHRGCWSTASTLSRVSRNFVQLVHRISCLRPGSHPRASHVKRTLCLLETARNFGNLIRLERILAQVFVALALHSASKVQRAKLAVKTLPFLFVRVPEHLTSEEFLLGWQLAHIRFLRICDVCVQEARCNKLVEQVLSFNLLRVIFQVLVSFRMLWPHGHCATKFWCYWGEWSCPWGSESQVRLEG